MEQFSMEKTIGKDWVAIWNDSLKKRILRVLILTHCGICDYLIDIESVDAIGEGLPKCRICGNRSAFRINSIEAKMTCIKSKKTLA